MKNEDLSSAIRKQFGTQNTLLFCKMVSTMYDLLHKDAKERKLDNEFGYDYERDWWNIEYAKISSEINLMQSVKHKK